MLLKRLLPIAIFAGLIAIAALILENPPQAQRGGPPTGPRMVVEVESVKRGPYAIAVQSYGTVQPRTQSMLVAQVSGQIVDVEPAFRPGGFFQADDVLVTIDPRDYDANVKIAEATLMDAAQVAAQEQARSEQALIDWERLGGGEPPSDLVLRKPQLAAAEARVASARSALAKARLEFERTVIRAPFAGRLLRQLVDRGQVVNNGAQLAEIFASDYVEVRLPIRNSDLPYVDLPESGNAAQPAVTFASELGDVRYEGRIVRTESAIDTSSRQLHVIAQIDDPFGLESAVNERPIKIGEYVTAEIKGREMRSALVIPSAVIYQNTYVYVVEDDVLQRRDVIVDWQNGRDAIIRSGLETNDQLVTTALGQVSSGTRVQIADSTRRPPPRRVSDSPFEGGSSRSTPRGDAPEPLTDGGEES